MTKRERKAMSFVTVDLESKSLCFLLAPFDVKFGHNQKVTAVMASLSVEVSIHSNRHSSTRIGPIHDCAFRILVPPTILSSLPSFSP